MKYSDDEILQTCENADKTPALTVEEVYHSPGPENDCRTPNYESMYNYDDDRYNDNDVDDDNTDDSSSDAESNVKHSSSNSKTNNEETGGETSNDEILTQLKAMNKLLAQLQKRLQKTEINIKSLEDKIEKKGKLKTLVRPKAPVEVQVN